MSPWSEKLTSGRDGGGFFTRRDYPHPCHPRAGGDPGTREARLSEALDSRLRGNDESEQRGELWQGVDRVAPRRLREFLFGDPAQLSERGADARQLARLVAPLGLAGRTLF